MATLTLDSHASVSHLLPQFLCLKFVEHNHLLSISAINFSQQDENSFTTLTLPSGDVVRNEQILVYVARLAASLHIDYDSHHELALKFVRLSQEMIDVNFTKLNFICKELNVHLTLRSYVVGYNLSIVDIALWATIRANKAGRSVFSQIGCNLLRWYEFVSNSDGGWATTQADRFSASMGEFRNAKRKDGASYTLTGIEHSGPVVTRFPPEPSGYLHLGHAKAALLNDYFARSTPGGTLICRFDDTNPSKESREFQDSILDDLKMLDIQPDKVSYSSNHFQTMYELALRLVNDGNAFADDSELGQGDVSRKNRLPSARRDMSIEETLQHFSEMKTGSVEGRRWCIRARIAYDSPNGTLRDPVIYRCNQTPHHRTGTAWKIYPTYDFCAPILDSIEGVTLALRTNEYRDRNAQYEWMQQSLGLRKVAIYDFSRMNFVRTVLSKRKLAKIVALGKVLGWDDPRMPTIRGTLRRGLTVAALREFILSQGPSRNILNLEWGAIWAANKKKIDPLAPRLVAIVSRDAVKCKISGLTGPNTAQWPRHAKNSSLGFKTVNFSRNILIEQSDAASFGKDEEITLMSWGNVFVRRIEKQDWKVVGLDLELNLTGDVKTTKKKITWLTSSDDDLVEASLISFDYLIMKDKLEKTDDLEQYLNPVTKSTNEAWTDRNIYDVNRGGVIQFERKGFYRLDFTSDDGRLVFFKIPA